MKKIRKILPVLLTALLLMSVWPVHAEAAGHWAEDIVSRLNTAYGEDAFTADDENITVEEAKAFFEDTLNFNADSCFAGDGTSNITRLQACQAVWAMSGLALPSGIVPTIFSDCTDVAVGSLAASGIVAEMSDNIFEPDGTVTNGQLAVIVYRTLNKMGGVTIGKDILEGTLEPFTDLNPDDWFYDGIMFLKGKEIMTGYPDGSFGGNKEVTFAEGATLLMRCYGLTQHGMSGFDFQQAVNAEYASLILGTDDSSSGYFRFTNYEDFKNNFYEVFTNHDWEIPHYSGHGTWDENGIFTPNETCQDIEDPHGHASIDAPGIAQLNWAAPYIWLMKDFFDSFAVSSFTPGTQNYISGVAQPETAGTLLTRELMAYVAVGLYNDYDEDTVNTLSLDRFQDGDFVGDAYRPAIAYLISIGAMNEPINGFLKPNETVTRAEIGVFMARVLQGLDTSKMHDYETAANTAVGGGN